MAGNEKNELYGGKCDGCQKIIRDKTMEKLPAPAPFPLKAGVDHYFLCPQCFEHLLLQSEGVTKEEFLDDLGLKSGLE